MSCRIDSGVGLAFITRKYMPYTYIMATKKAGIFHQEDFCLTPQCLQVLRPNKERTVRSTWPELFAGPSRRSSSRYFSAAGARLCEPQHARNFMMLNPFPIHPAWRSCCESQTRAPERGSVSRSTAPHF